MPFIFVESKQIFISKRLNKVDSMANNYNMRRERYIFFVIFQEATNGMLYMIYQMLSIEYE